MDLFLIGPACDWEWILAVGSVRLKKYVFAGEEGRKDKDKDKDKDLGKKYISPRMAGGCSSEERKAKLRISRHHLLLLILGGAGDDDDDGNSDHNDDAVVLLLWSEISHPSIPSDRH